MARKLLVEMDASEYHRFNLFERMVRRLRDKTGKDESMILEVLEKTAESALKPPTESAKK